MPTDSKRVKAREARVARRGPPRVRAVGGTDRRARFVEARARACLSKRTVMVPHRYPAKTLPTRSDTDSPAPRSSSMRALDASAALATRARSIAESTRAHREARCDAPEYTPRGADAAPNEVLAIWAGVPRSTTKKKSDDAAWSRANRPELLETRNRSAGASTRPESLPGSAFAEKRTLQSDAHRLFDGPIICTRECELCSATRTSLFQDAPKRSSRVCTSVR